MAGVRALRAGDPSGVGGYRLLGRLGAGGMGVVYLARSAGGGLVALKVIRAEYAAEDAFRARFRREAEAAGRLTGRWLVPVVAAAPQEGEPWLATAYVPGPSLAEAVALHGPLPPTAVRVLGARLAEALTEVHAAGLVHRDVKPGNVLLALDGPRLIDFGIARSTGATALTATDAVIGSPGFLSPEQARGRAGEPGPPSDVFSLGCVLAYAATGRRPFGDGTPAGMLFRTVHEEPDLDGVPAALAPLLAACLAKDPAARPGARAVRERLAGAEAEAGADGAGGAGGAEASSGGGAEDADWLPAALARLIAERSAAVLTLPAPETEEPPDGARDTTPEATPDTAPAAARPLFARRRLLALGSAAGVVAAGGGLAVWSARARGGAGGRSEEKPLPRYAIGLQADLSGDRKAAGRAQERGARLAVAELNSGRGQGFRLTLRVRDDGGTVARARQAAAGFTGDPEVYAVIGPTGDAATEAVVPAYQKALLPLLTVSAATDEFHAPVERAFFQLRPDQNALATAVLHYLTHTAGSRRTAVVDDRAARRSSWSLAQSLTATPPGGGTVTVHSVPADSDDFGPAAAAVRAAKAQAVVYGGTSPERAARCARALERAGFRGTRMATEPVLDDAFGERAGRAAEGWVFATSYADPAGLPGAADFVAAYRERYGGGAVEPFAVEAYDAVRLVAQGLRELTAADSDSDSDSGSGTGTGTASRAGPERGALVRVLRASSHQGLAKRLRFPPPTEEFRSTDGLFLHRVENGTAHFLGRHDDPR